MSIEQKIDALTATLGALVEVLTKRASTVVAQPVQVVDHHPQVAQVVEQPVIVQPAPVVAPAAPVAPVAVAVAPAPVAATMPPLPSFAPPVVPVSVPVTAPFTDTKGMIEYVTTAYKAMGSEKGARIQQVILALGVQNINDITPEQYGALHQGIEALRNGA